MYMTVLTRLPKEDAVCKHCLTVTVHGMLLWFSRFVVVVNRGR